jgi:hypothetical protein
MTERERERRERGGGKKESDRSPKRSGQSKMARHQISSRLCDAEREKKRRDAVTHTHTHMKEETLFSFFLSSFFGQAVGWKANQTFKRLTDRLSQSFKKLCDEALAHLNKLRFGLIIDSFSQAKQEK